MSSTMPTNGTLQTEFSFTLPRGYVDTTGRLHKEGTMRLATAMDEIAPLREPFVRENPAYLTVVLLARVVTRLGNLAEVNTHTVENLFAGDLTYLQDLYRRLNTNGEEVRTVTCPNCRLVFREEATPPGEP